MVRCRVRSLCVRVYRRHRGGARASVSRKNTEHRLGSNLSRTCRARRGWGAANDDARDGDDAGRSSRSECPRGVSARGDADARGRARGYVVARARGAGERARAPSRGACDTPCGRHRVSVRDDRPSRAKGTTPRRPAREPINAGRRPVKPRLARSRMRTIAGALDEERAHDAAKPGGWVTMCHPRDGRVETHAQRTIPNRWLGAFASGTARVSPTVARPARRKLAEPLWMPRPVLNGGEQDAARASASYPFARTGTPRDGQVSSLLPSPRLWICMVPVKSARPIRSADLPIPGNLPRVEI